MQIKLDVDAYWNVEERDIRKAPTGIPHTVKNLLGWKITGPFNQKTNSSGSNSHSTKLNDLNHQEDAIFTETVEKFWKVGKTGIYEEKKATFSEKSKRQLRFMEQSIEHDEDCYKVNLLWKSEVNMQYNYPVAKAQLQSAT